MPRAALLLALCATAAAAQQPPVIPKIDPERQKQIEKEREAFKAKLAETLKKQEDLVAKLTADPGPDDPKTRAARGELGAMLYHAGQYEKALPHVEDEYRREKKTKTLDDPTFQVLTGRMAQTYLGVRQFGPAAAVYEEWYAFAQKKHGPDSAIALGFAQTLAEVHLSAGQPDRAAAVYQPFLDRHAAAKAGDTPVVLNAIGGLARAREAAGKHAEALALRADVFDRWVKLAGKADGLENLRVGLADAYFAAGKVREALPHYDALAAYGAKVFGPDHGYTLAARNRAAQCHAGLGAFDVAEPILADVLEKSRAAAGPEGEQTLTLREGAAAAYDAAGKHAAAEAHWRAVAEARAKGGDATAAQAATTRANLGLNLLKQEKWAAAEPILRDCLAAREKLFPDDWRTFNTKSMLGGALLGLGKHAAAEPLLVAGYAGLKARAAAIPGAGLPRLREAADRLAGLYDATARPAEAAAVRRERDEKK